MEEQLTIEAQGAVDELWAEEGIPFKLTAHKVKAGVEPGYFTIYFLDTRLRSLFVYWNPNKGSFKKPFERWPSIPSGKGHEVRPK